MNNKNNNGQDKNKNSDSNNEDKENFDKSEINDSDNACEKISENPDGEKGVTREDPGNLAIDSNISEENANASEENSNIPSKKENNSGNTPRDQVPQSQESQAQDSQGQKAQDQEVDSEAQDQETADQAQEIHDQDQEILDAMKDYLDNFDHFRTSEPNSAGANNPGANNPGANNPGAQNPNIDNPGASGNQNNFMSEIFNGLGMNGMSLNSLSEMFGGGENQQNLFSALNSANPFAMLFSGNQEELDVQMIKQLLFFRYSQIPPETTNLQMSEQCHSALSNADLWIDIFTDFPSQIHKRKVADAKTLANNLVDDSVDFANVTAKRIANGLVESVTNKFGDSFEAQIETVVSDDENKEKNIMSSPKAMIPLLKNGIFVSFAKQLCDAIFKTANTAFSMHDPAIPTEKGETATLRYEGIKNLSKKTGIPIKSILQYFAVREVAYARIFYNVKWLKSYMLALFEKYAREIDITLDKFIDEVMHSLEDMDIDPGSLNGIAFGFKDISSLLGNADSDINSDFYDKGDDEEYESEERHESLSDFLHITENGDKTNGVAVDMSGSFALSLLIEQTDESLKVLSKIIDLLILIESWVLFVTFRTTISHIPETADLHNYFLREKIGFSAIETMYSTLLCEKVEISDLSKAFKFWEKVFAEKGVEFTDSVWSHPDNLPTKDDVFSPDSFIKYGHSSDLFDSLENNIDWDFELDKLYKTEAKKHEGDKAEKDFDATAEGKRENDKKQSGSTEEKSAKEKEQAGLTGEKSENVKKTPGPAEEKIKQKDIPAAEEKSRENKNKDANENKIPAEKNEQKDTHVAENGSEVDGKDKNSDDKIEDEDENPDDNADEESNKNK